MLAHIHISYFLTILKIGVLSLYWNKNIFRKSVTIVEISQSKKITTTATFKKINFFLQSIVNMKVVRSTVKHSFCRRKVYVFVDIGMLGLVFKHLPRDMASFIAMS